MAQRHGLAGTYGRIEAIKRFQRAFLLFAASSMLCTGGLCFAWGYFWSRHGAWYGNAAGIVGLGLMWLAFEYFGKHLELIGRERIKFLRGGQAEALVAWILEAELDESWHVFNGVKLEDESDHDHIVVGPGGIFLISTKSHRGWFVGSAAELKRNMKACPFALDARRQAAKLAARLKALMGEGVPWVQAVLCVPFGYTDGDVFNGNVWLTHADDLTDRIAPEKPAKKLTKDQVARAVKAMEMIQADAAKVYERPNPS